MKLYTTLKGKDFVWQVMKVDGDKVWISEQSDEGQPNDMNEWYLYTKQEIDEYVKSGTLVPFD